jgi:hypothetical protein
MKSAFETDLIPRQMKNHVIASQASSDFKYIKNATFLLNRLFVFYSTRSSLNVFFVVGKKEKFQRRNKSIFSPGIMHP